MGSCLSSSDGGGGGRSNSSATSSPLSQGARKGKKGRRRRPFEEQHMLHKIPGRMFANGTSGVASLFTQQGKKGTNQDAMIVWENFGSRADTIFCGVFDGHGPYGHMVARRVRDSLPLKLSSHWEVNVGNDGLSRENSINMVGSPNAEETASLCADDGLSDSIHLDQETHPEIFSILKESFLKAFKVMDKELKLHPSIDCFCSGTTAVTLVKQGNDLVIGNVGDSRAVLGTRDQNDCLTAVQLTVDLKPNLPKEEARIKQHNGRVFSLRDEPEVARVWLPYNDSPGLAMARAFGDFCLKDYGLISVPEVSYRRLTEKDEFIVLATDGVWDVLSNTEVVDIVAAAPRSSAARSLVQSAVRAWRYKYPTSKIDDCAVVCLFLDNNSGDLIGSCSSGTLTKEKLEAGSNSTEKKSSPSPMTTWDPLGIREEGKGKGKGKEESKVGELSGSESCPQSPSDSQAGSGVEGDEWSALEGVSRTNTLLTLPRFNDPVEKKSARSNSTKKVA